MIRDREMKLDELAKATKVEARTIRLYIAQGLVPPPLRTGRDAAYDSQHVDAIRSVRLLQERGLSLAEIRNQLYGKPARSTEVEQLVQVTLDDGVYLVVKNGAWSWAKIRAAVKLLQENGER